MERIVVHTKPAYDIYVGQGCVHKALEIAKDYQQSVVITDSNVAQTHGGILGMLCENPLIVEAGERAKSMAVAQTLLEQMAQRGLNRRSLVIALGGGVVGDLGGFCAAIYMRGIDCIQVPTTLLAQVDSAIGGKTGVNLSQGKNLVGCFHQPRAVLEDPDFLGTLAREQVLCGIGEIVKYGIIWPSFYAECANWTNLYLRDEKQALAAAPVAQCAAIKGEVVAKDEKEGGLRKILNAGHTCAHALEGVLGYGGITHGQAVLYGLAMEALMAAKLGMLERARATVYLEMFAPLLLLCAKDLGALDVQALMGYTLHDKKNVGGEISFMLPCDEGGVRERMVSPEKAAELYAFSIEKLAQEGLITCM